MGRGVDISLIGVDISCVDDRYTMGREVDIPWVGRSIYHG